MLNVCWNDIYVEPTNQFRVFIHAEAIACAISLSINFPASTHECKYVLGDSSFRMFIFRLNLMFTNDS